MLDMGQMTPSQVKSYNKRLSPKMRRWAEPQQDSRLENLISDPIHLLWTQQYGIDCVLWYSSDRLPQAYFPYVACELKRSREKLFQNCTHVLTVTRTILKCPSYKRKQGSTAWISCTRASRSYECCAVKMITGWPFEKILKPEQSSSNFENGTMMNLA